MLFIVSLPQLELDVYTSIIVIKLGVFKFYPNIEI